MNTGKAVIIFIVIVALAMSGFACWYHFQDGKQSLAFWGVESANLIRHAKTVERLTLVPQESVDGDIPAASELPKLEVYGKPMLVQSSKDISQNRGLVHARHTLVEDANFEWDAAIPTVSKKWDFALRFIDGKKQATVAFDLYTHSATLVGTDKSVSMPEAIKRLHAWSFRDDAPVGNTDDPETPEPTTSTP